MFLAIINDTYAEVKAEISSDDEIAVIDYFKNISSQFLKLGKQKEQIEGIQQAIKVSKQMFVIRQFSQNFIITTGL